MTTLRAKPVCSVVTTFAWLVLSHGVQAQTGRSQRPLDPNAPIVIDEFSLGTLSQEQSAAFVDRVRAQALERLTWLEDPEQRTTVLADYQTRIRRANPDLVEIIGLPPQLEPQLVAMLAEQQLAQDIRSYKQQVTNDRGRAPTASQGTYGELLAVYDRDRGALKKLLGPARFGRYLSYLDTVGERQRVNSPGWLGEQPLSREQKEQLIVVLAEQRRALNDLTREARTGIVPGEITALPSDDLEAQRRSAALAIVRRQERSLDAGIQLNETLLQATAKFLSEAQQAALASHETNRLEGSRKYLRALRSKVGLAPDQSVNTVAPRKEPQPVMGPLLWTLRLSVNQRPAQRLKIKSRSGETMRFEAAESLSIDAVATAYDNGRVHVKLNVFEQDVTGRHRIGELHGNGPLNPVMRSGPTVEAASEVLNTSIAAIAGSKGYELAMSTDGVLQ